LIQEFESDDESFENESKALDLNSERRKMFYRGVPAVVSKYRDFIKI
jgi:hypothetical protein